MERRAVILSKEKTVLEARLNRLYDNLCDGVINAEAFNCKETQYKAQMADVVGALQECGRDRQVEVNEGFRILELANRLYPTYLDMGYEKRAKVLKLLASNYTLNDGSLSATYRKPFIFIADLPPRPMKLPRLSRTQNFSTLIPA